MKLRITFDARWLSTGLGTYTINVLQNLRSVGDVHVHGITMSENRSKIAPLCDDCTIVDAPIYSLQEQLRVPWAARKAALLHVPHYNAPVLFPGPLLVSILDLTHILDETYRRTWKSRLYARPMYQAAAWRAQHIFTLSEYSKACIMKHLGVAEEKISVAHCGVGSHFLPIEEALASRIIDGSLGLNRSYLLYVGHLKPHKNIPCLMRAYSSLVRSGYKECDLVLVGEDRGGRTPLEALARELDLAQKVRFVPYVREEDMPALYAAAKCLILPSFEEGFGLPVVEAMACGTPVICSNAASLPEVAGDAALQFDPRQDNELLECLRRVLTDNSLRTQMRTKGVANAARFTWQACARVHFDVYQRMLSS